MRRPPFTWMLDWRLSGLVLFLSTIVTHAFPITEHSHFRRLLPKNDLPSGRVDSIYQDSRGFMWFGTPSGLSRYDGFSFVHYENRPGDTNTLTSGAVRDIKEDSLGNLWVATGGGLNYYDRQKESFRQFVTKSPTTPGLYSNNISCLHLDEQGHVWLGTLGEALHRFDPATEKFEHFYFPGPRRGTSRPVDYIGTIASDTRGRLWAGTVSGRLFVNGDGNKFTPINLPKRSRPNGSISKIYDLLPGEDGTLIAATHSGIYQVALDGAQARYDFNFASVCAALRNIKVDSLMRDRDGLLWIGTDGQGLFVYDPDSDSHVRIRNQGHIPSSIATDVIRCIFEDQMGDVWLGHYPNGVSFTSRVTAFFRSIRPNPIAPNGLSHSSVTDFEEDSGGNIWITTDGGGLNYWDRTANTFRSYQASDGSGLSASATLAVLKDQDERLWVGTWAGGLNRLEAGSNYFRTYTPNPKNPGSLSNANVFSLLQDRRGVIWAGTMNGGLNRYQPDIDGFKRYLPNRRNPKSIKGNQAWVLFEDHQGVLWVGTNRGLNRYNRGQDNFDSFLPQPSSPASPKSQWISAMYQSSDLKYWVGTLGAGLYEFDTANGFGRQISEADGLSSNMVCGILEDDSGDLWISTYDGLTRFNPATGTCSTYGEASGLPGQQFNRFTATHKTERGELLFGASEGLLIVRPELRQPIAEVPKVEFTELRLNNKLITPQSEGSPLSSGISECSELVLDWGYSLIELKFAVLDYRMPEHNSLRFRLEGWDDNWREADKSRSASYANLAPGRYELRVQASDSEGLSRNSEAALALEVIPPYWMTHWFKALAGVLVVSLVLLIGWSIARIRMLRSLYEAKNEARILKERQIMHEEMRQRQKMEAIGTMASGISHDFNNILTGMILNIESLQDGSDPRLSSRTEITEVERLAHRAQRLVRQILTFSRNEDIEAAPHDFVKVVKSGLDLLRATLPQSIHIDETFPKAPLVVMASETQFHQIILNLGSNAAQAMTSDNGFIRVTVDQTTAPEDPSLPEKLRGQPSVRLQFQDDGCGMSEETAARMFDPFFTTKTREKGTGLGMAVVFGIVKSHHGDISVSSVQGKGTVFTILFPLEQGKAPIREPKTSFGISPPAQAKRIMVVDDENPIVDVLNRALKSRGYEVDCFPLGTKALASFRSDPNRFDLVISDYMMPELNGLEMIKEMKRIRPGLNAVLMSGAAEKLDDTVSRDDGPDATVDKPFQLKKLLKTLSEVVNKNN